MSYSLYIVSLSLFTFASFGYLLDIKMTRWFNSLAPTLFNLATLTLVIFTTQQYLQGSSDTALLLITLTAIASCIFMYFFKINALASFISPFISLVLIIIPLLERSGFATPTTSESSTVSALLYSHIILAVLGQTLAILAASVSALYILQFNSLKKRHFNSLLNTLPGLDKLSYIMKLSLNVGFFLLSLALLSGIIYTQMFWQDSNNELLPKIVWAILIWLWYLACLWLTQVIKVKTLTLAKMSLIGFVLLFVGYFGLFYKFPLWNL